VEAAWSKREVLLKEGWQFGKLGLWIDGEEEDQMVEVLGGRHDFCNLKAMCPA
jgi:hypothetical protein